MADRCLHCHTNVREQLDAGRPLHGRLDDAADCRGCHTEHNGPTAVLTSMAKFNHDLTAYPLTGAHCKVDCAKCHVTAGFQGVPKTCLGCHAEPPIHQRRLGTDCETCHNTQTWDGALFDHSFFSVSHHQRRQANTCATCHKDPTNYTICSCSGTGCHSRTTPRIAQMLKPRSPAEELKSVFHPCFIRGPKTSDRLPCEPSRGARRAPAPRIRHTGSPRRSRSTSRRDTWPDSASAARRDRR